MLRFFPMLITYTDNSKIEKYKKEEQAYIISIITVICNYAYKTSETFYSFLQYFI